MRKLSIAAVALAVLVGVGACGVDSDPDFTTAEAVHFVEDQLSARTDAGAVQLPYWHKTIDEALPNVSYLRPGEAPATLTDLVAVGTVSQVEKGKGFIVKDEDAATGTPGDFDHKDAKWRYVHATVEVERTVASTESPDTVKFALPLDHPEEFEKMAAGLKAMGRLVFFLDKDSPHVPYDKSLYVAIDNHGLIARVADDGSLSLPFQTAEKASALLSGVTRFEDLEARGRTPRALPLARVPGAHFYTRAT